MFAVRLKSSVLRLGILFHLLLPLAGQSQPIPVEPKAAPWTEFVKTEGHETTIPKGWLATEEGRFAHAIKLPETIPTTVPFDFKSAWWKAVKPREKSVARQYWEHLCATEAGSFILHPVDAVDGFFFMRPVSGATEQQNNDRWKLEAPGLAASWGFRYDPERGAEGFINPPWATYEWVDFPAAQGSGVLHMWGHVNYFPERSDQRVFLPMKVERQPDSTARYGLTWRGIRRERDREHAISGAEWIALDRQTGELLGLLRDFYLTGMTTNQREGIYWLNAARCPFKRQQFGHAGDDREAKVWTPMVLRPKVYPKELQIMDERKRGVKK